MQFHKYLMRQKDERPEVNVCIQRISSLSAENPFVLRIPLNCHELSTENRHSFQGKVNVTPAS